MAIERRLGAVAMPPIPLQTPPLCCESIERPKSSSQRCGEAPMFHDHLIENNFTLRRRLMPSRQRRAVTALLRRGHVAGSVGALPIPQPRRPESGRGRRRARFVSSANRRNACRGEDLAEGGPREKHERDEDRKPAGPSE